MSDWKHELTRNQYDAVVASLTKAATLVIVIQEMGEDVEAHVRSAMLTSLKSFISDCFTLGNFNLEDVETAETAYLRSLDL